MFTTLTYREWDNLCTKMEHAMGIIPMIHGLASYEGVGLMDEISDVHGDLMMRPTTPVEIYGLDAPQTHHEW